MSWNRACQYLVARSLHIHGSSVVLLGITFSRGPQVWQENWEQLLPRVRPRDPFLLPPAKKSPVSGSIKIVGLLNPPCSPPGQQVQLQEVNFAVIEGAQSWQEKLGSWSHKEVLTGLGA